jgi:hypothetical protein
MHVAYNSHGNLMIFLSLSLTIWFLVTHPFLLFCFSCPVYELVISILVVICQNGFWKSFHEFDTFIPFIASYMPSVPACECVLCMLFSSVGVLDKWILGAFIFIRGISINPTTCKYFGQWSQGIAIGHAK